jgi:hypothetical protein
MMPVAEKYFISGKRSFCKRREFNMTRVRIARRGAMVIRKAAIILPG